MIIRPSNESISHETTMESTKKKGERKRKKKKTNGKHVLIRELKEAFRTTAAVFGALTLETVGKKHRETAHTLPLLFARSDKLIDDDLSAVAKVTELSLPHDETIWTLETVSVFKAKDGVFREGAVDDVKVALMRREMFEG